MQKFHEGEIDKNKQSGVLGMGNGIYGFMEQTKLMFNGMFSYCLQPIFTQGSSPMYLRFGNDVLPQPIQMQVTPIYKYDYSKAYYLNLQGISVGAQRLPIDPDIFAMKSDETGGCIIDSGSSLSWIVTGAFNVFKDAVISFIKDSNRDNNWRKMRKHETEYDLCYQRYKLPDTMVLPVITFHFENNADYVIDVRESFYLGTSSQGRDMVCLQYFESTIDHHDGVTYLGGMQQANKRIVYDLENSLLHFGHADCSNEN
ncbi:aspartic proteinase nepenthesin-1-like [Silene latifolia]|uniref:aspartic proteinase nepenthesin-1-like n=1 Tax=Silene latifolia TaxID=37657 RepID=UPI003D771CBA